MKHKPLQLSDIEHLIPPPPPGLDEVTLGYLHNMKVQMKQRQLSLLNKYLNVLFEIYPQGNSLLFFVALEMCSSNIEKLLSNLRNSDFIANLLDQAQALGIRIGNDPDDNVINEFKEI